MHDVFINYAREDKAIAQKLYDGLSKAGIKPWIASKNLLPGSVWKREIPRAIRNSKYVLILQSTKSISKRGHIQGEI